LTTVDHKRLGILYILSALLFLAVGGVEALIIRIQLMHSHSTFVSPQIFNRMFTMHGTTMIFFVTMPVLFGFANYLVPLMIGARDMAFPRLNAFSFWLTARWVDFCFTSVSWVEMGSTARAMHPTWMVGARTPNRTGVFSRPQL
jgi:heme/copper-type cytochrome/quinol oxidase subunit 1